MSSRPLASVQVLQRPDLAVLFAASGDVAFYMSSGLEEVLFSALAALCMVQALSGKPEAVWPKIIEGQIAKWYKEVCLLDQIWVKDPEGKKDIRSLLTDLIAKTGENVRVRRFVRYEVGEGLEKRADDFAAEVKKQAGQA